jgi:hypothetical protein
MWPEALYTTRLPSDWITDSKAVGAGTCTCAGGGGGPEGGNRVLEEDGVAVALHDEAESAVLGPDVLALEEGHAGAVLVHVGNPPWA